MHISLIAQTLVRKFCCLIPKLTQRATSPCFYFKNCNICSLFNIRFVLCVVSQIVNCDINFINTCLINVDEAFTTFILWVWE